MAYDMGRHGVELAKEPQAVCRVPSNGQGGIRRAAAGVAAPVIADKLAFFEGGLSHQWPICISHEGAVDKDNRLARALEFIFERYCVDINAIHQTASFCRSCSVA